MITIIRRNQRWLLLLIAILTIIAFAWLYNTTDTDKLGANRVAQMYGETVYQVDIDKAVRLQQLAVILGMNDFLRELSATATSQEQALEEFVWNLLVLRHEADALWLHATEEQVLEGIRSLPSLSTAGAFDRAKYVALLQEQMAPRGLTERHLEQLMRDSFALQTLRSLVVSPLALSPSEVEETMQFFQKTDALLVNIPALPQEQKPTVAEEDIANFYEQNQAQITTQPFRSVAVAEMILPEDQRQLTGRERVNALQNVANAVSEFHEKVTAEGADFATLAQEAGASYRVTQPFDLRGNTQGSSPAEPGESASLPTNVVAQAFRLTPSSSISEIVQDGDAFYVVKLLEEIPARPMTLAEVRPQIERMLAQQKLDEAEQKYAEGFRASIQEAVAAGQNFADAVAAQGMSAQELTGLEPWSQEMGPNLFYGRATAEMKEGDVSEVLRGMEGYSLVYLTKRHPMEPSMRQEREAEMRENLLGSKQTILFIEWLRLAREKSDLRFFSSSR